LDRSQLTDTAKAEKAKKLETRENFMVVRLIYDILSAVGCEIII